jgi:fumarylacetoacetate (FAA) hydrolase
VRIAHVREVSGPTGSPFRLAAALPDGRWLDLGVARRHLARREPGLAHNNPLFRVPLATLDALLASGLRVEALRAVVEPFLERAELLPPTADEGDGLTLDSVDLRFGPPILRPRSLRDFYAFEGHVATMWARRGSEVPDAWYRLPIFYFSNVSEIRGPGDVVWIPRGSSELDYELEIAALVDTPARDLSDERAEEAIGGYTVFNDWSARDLQREETTVRLGPAKGKDFASTLGPWLVTPDELAEVRTGKGYALAATASVNGSELSRGSWSDIRFSFGEMLARASSDARLVPGDVVGSGTVGTGCLLEIRESSGFGRYLEPGDTVTLAVERLGELTTPIVERRERRLP